MKKASSKIGFKKITLSNLSNEALEALKGGSSYVTYNCATNTCHCPPPTANCTFGCNNSLRFMCEVYPIDPLQNEA
jgi:hypothetical protein